MMMESMFENIIFILKLNIYFISIEDDFMAWATLFWENVCQKYELVINADGSS